MGNSFPQSGRHYILDGTLFLLLHSRVENNNIKNIH
jgi:hypothetical protein